MRLLLSASLLGLAWFASVNLIASAATWFIVRMFGTRLLARTGAALWLRLLPAALAALFALAVFVPAHLLLEPADPNESFGVLLPMLAAGAILLLARSAARLLKVVDTATRTAILLRRTGGTGDVYDIAGYRGISLAGVFRTRILVGSHARRILTPGELDLAIAHERAHRRAFDNLKRCLIFCAPDFIGWTRTAQALERQWRMQAECAADARAARGDEGRALCLASALVKVARSRGQVAGALHSPVWSTFHDAPLLEARVRRLVSGQTPSPPASLRATGVLGLAAIGMTTVWYAGIPPYIHRTTEIVIGMLP